MDNSYTSNTFPFSFEGRINRAKYWYALVAGVTSCAVCLGLLALALGAIFGVGVTSVDVDFDQVFTDPLSVPFHADFAGAASPSNRLMASVLFNGGGIPIFLVGIWFLTAATVKRLHDRNKSGWWIFPFFVAPRLLANIGHWLGNFTLVNLLLLALSALSIWGFVEVLFMKGTTGETRFGSDPLAPTNAGRPASLHWDQQSELELVPHRSHRTQPK